MVFNAPKLDYLWLGRTHSVVDVLQKTDVSQNSSSKMYVQNCWENNLTNFKILWSQDRELELY